jgi:SAM-dependent methyltransferase
MIRCPRCGRAHAPQIEGCDVCGFRPALVDGFPAWAPQLANKSEGFKSEYFKRLAQLEAGNFWFRARNRLIIWALRKYASSAKSFLEVGCGTGFVLSGVARALPQARLVGTELFSAGLHFAARRVPNATFAQMDARHVPYEDEFDVVGAFDVVEHITQDERVLDGLRCAARPGGIVMLTVPQHPALWSASDEFARHVRRYTASELHEKVRHAGLDIVRSTSFMTITLPAMLISRGANRDVSKFDPTAELTVARPLNIALELALKAERAAIMAGVSLPVGGSRLIVARRSEH